MIDATFIAIGLFSFVFHRHRWASLFFAPNQTPWMQVKTDIDDYRLDSRREIEEWSVLGNRDIDGKTREVAGELLGK